MANKFRYRRGPQISRKVKKTGTVAIEQGDMLKIIWGTGRVTAALLSSDCDDLVGIAMDASPTTDATATEIRMLEIGHGTVFEMTVASATQIYGQQYVISAKQLLLKYASTSGFDSATNSVAVCVEDLDTAGTSVLVQFMPGALQKQIVES